MKKFICILILCLALAIVFSSCANDQEEEESITSSSVETSSAELNTEPMDTKSVSPDEMGLECYLLSGGDDLIAKAKATVDGSVKITSYNAGTTEFIVTNVYSETARLTVTVGADLLIESIDVAPFEKAEHFVVASDFGMSPDNDDNSEALQNAIDSLTEGGTVYVPAGTYKTTDIVMRENVVLRLSGVLAEYNTQYTEKVDLIVEKSDKFAIIDFIGGGKLGCIINHPYKDWGRNGAGNFAVIGGMLDLNTKNRAFVLSCGENIRIENTIIRNTGNMHAIQIAGCENVSFKNVMFAGYGFNGAATAEEMIQIEGTHPGAVGAAETAASQFETYEYYESKNISFENCYFGKSLDQDAPTYAIGHHGQQDSVACDGLKIINCTFDNPRVCAIRAFAYSGVEISGCKFISDRDNCVVPKESRYMLELNIKVGDVKMSDGTYLCTSYDRGGCNDYDIHDNTFVIGEKSGMAGIITNLTIGATTSDAVATGSIKRTDFYTNPAKVFKGYIMANNHVSNIRIYDNDITVNNGKTTYIYALMGVKGLYFNNNSLHTSKSFASVSFDGADVVGARLIDCFTIDYMKKNFLVTAVSANKTVPIVLDETQTSMYYLGSANTCNIKFIATDGGRVERWVTEDGKLHVSGVADEGYVFDGYYINGQKISDHTTDFRAATTVEMRFVAA